MVRPCYFKGEIKGLQAFLLEELDELEHMELLYPVGWMLGKPPLFLYLSFQCAIMASLKSPCLRHTSLNVLFFSCFFHCHLRFFGGVYMYIYIHNIYVSLVVSNQPIRKKLVVKQKPRSAGPQHIPSPGRLRAGWRLTWSLRTFKRRFLEFWKKRFDVENRHEILILLRIIIELNILHETS